MDFFFDKQCMQFIAQQTQLKNLGRLDNQPASLKIIDFYYIPEAY